MKWASEMQLICSFTSEVELYPKCEMNVSTVTAVLLQHRMLLFQVKTQQNAIFQQTEFL